MERIIRKKKLGVNIDHIATLRQARMGIEPDPVAIIPIAELAGADSITMHLREDRRHIQDRDLYLAKHIVKTSLNLEMSINDEIVKIALDVVPNEVCIVPERREEITTEGGLQIKPIKSRLEDVIVELKKKNIIVSLFVEPDREAIELSKEVGADYIEIHTGKYSNAYGKEQENELEKIRRSAEYACSIGLGVNAGHGLNYKNTYDIASIPEVETLNIGHSIISRSVYVGIRQAVVEMKDIILRAYYDLISVTNR
ncbi:MAG: pyridoxine 5'-phosphate synthase [Spirochaetia bacterium]|nr:pyridoxine 5'-phosphate synthase [Spirochaetota bacterium]MCX8097090.1 pyridoxine 5'-phosphate synthase [Spirochaetota bacterium]MDW8112659.1 pyridoxine 5'-phosphate synthase [Spirochaetia bacterium]